MIWTIVRNGFLGLRRDRGAFIMAFVLPVAFFSIFAFVFGSMGSQSTPRVSVIVVDEDHSPASARLLQGLKAEPSLNVSTRPSASPVTGKPAPAVDYTAATAETAVKQGDAPAAILIPKGFGANPIAFGPTGARPKFVILHDQSDPVSAQVASGMLQKVVMTSFGDVMADQGVKYMDQAVGGLTPQQRTAAEADLARYRQYLQKRDRQGAQGAKPAAGAAADGGIIAVSIRDVVGEKKKSPMISFYAAGIGVMFLMFTANAAAASLIDEAESGALDRMLSARVGMTALLAGKLVYCALLAFLQLTVMFLWGAAVFQLDLFSHIPGFIVMTAATAFAVAAFGMLLASLSRTRQQQQAVATLLILVMSAVGGSMFPRFMMPDVMKQIGLFTFNGWAIDGFTKVFWRDEPVTNLLPQLEVLIGSGIVLFLLARLFARRWETA